MKSKIVVTEYPDKGWTINLNKFNDETDIIVPKELAVEILRLQSLDHLNAEKGERYSEPVRECSNCGYTHSGECSTGKSDNIMCVCQKCGDNHFIGKPSAMGEGK